MTSLSRDYCFYLSTRIEVHELYFAEVLNTELEFVVHLVNLLLEFIPVLFYLDPVNMFTCTPVHGLWYSVHCTVIYLINLWICF